MKRLELDLVSRRRVPFAVWMMLLVGGVLSVDAVLRAAALDEDIERAAAASKAPRRGTLVADARVDPALAKDLRAAEQVVQKLEVTARMLTPLSIYLRQLAERAQAEANEHAAAAQATIASYAQAAYDELPERLRPFSAGRE